MFQVDFSASVPIHICFPFTPLLRVVRQGVLLGCTVHWAAAGGLGVGIPSGQIRVRCHSAAHGQVELGLGTGSWAPGCRGDAVGNSFASVGRLGTAWSAAWAAGTAAACSCLVVVDVLAGAAVAGTGLG